MSYTPSDQNIDDPLEKIIEGVKEFNAAVDARISAKGEWIPTHISSINDMRIKLLHLLPDLKKLTS